MRALIALLCLLSGPARALDACYADITGPWVGPVRNEGLIEELATEFSLAPDGRPEGRYHVAAAEPFDGTLGDFEETGPCEGDFTWTDRYGSGIVHIRFLPQRGRFLGNWGLDVPDAGHIFDGYRRGVPATS
jgi:hypothetical protein